MNKKDYRLVFMGTPDIAAIVFQRLIDDGYHFVGLIAQSDSPFGRRGLLSKVPTKIVAETYGIPVFQPEKIRLDYEFVKTMKPDLIVTFAYGQIIPQGLLDIPRYGCLNLHGSLLPKYRGAAPIQRAIMNGEKETGITLMEMIDKMDAGKMFAKTSMAIENEDNYSTLSRKLADLASKLIIEQLPLYLSGQLPGESQDESLVTFANKIKPEDEKMTIDLPVVQMVDYIRALSEAPGAYLLLNNLKLKIYKASFYSRAVEGKLGEIVATKGGVIVQLSDGQIALLDLQLEGRKRLSYKDFVNGQKNLVGSILS
ncbi:MAG: methionyl-tRNA formyltransferase [Bacilli bacterium]|jgi:methionyl-tRNA formyltransferase